jgi:hypothetical protein
MIIISLQIELWTLYRPLTYIGGWLIGEGWWFIQDFHDKYNILLIWYYGSTQIAISSPGRLFCFFSPFLKMFTNRLVTERIPKMDLELSAKRLHASAWHWRRGLRTENNISYPTFKFFCENFVFNMWPTTCKIESMNLANILQHLLINNKWVCIFKMKFQNWKYCCRHWLMRWEPLKH